ncbi:hypothetical protein ACFIQF_21685 [Comamonas sp. J-3]|jgi:hypothetical protein|uniref:hypothetical protein n=1 Tax=Comamonas trifloxystrobinivorans TaxID=3350256 RepID=UPI0037288C90
MQIPRYWAQVRLRHQTGLRHGCTVQRWGWSDESQLAADAHAKARAQEALELLLQPPEQRQLGRGFRRIEHAGTYGLSGETPIREEILEERGHAVKTRNSYGAHCLNTPDVAIADVDTAPAKPPLPHLFPVFSLALTLGPLLLLLLEAQAFTKQYLLSWLWIGFFALLFIRNLRRWLARPRQSAATEMERAALERITTFSQQHPDWGLRLYKTPKGLRVIVTHRPMRFDDADVKALFAALQVDPLYARLCKRQQCFRARVTGKPWRMGMNGPSEQARRWPVKEKHAAERQRWNQQYDARAQQYSACQFVSQLGVQSITAEVQPLVTWHDDSCQAHHATLPMA